MKKHTSSSSKMRHVSSDVQTPAFISMSPQRCRTGDAYSWTLYWNDVISRFRERSRDSRSCKQSEQTAACYMRHKLQPCVHPAYQCFHAAVRGLQNISQNLHLSSLSPDRLVRAALLFLFCVINKKKKKYSFCGDCSNSMMDVLFRLKEGRKQ